MGIKKQGTMGKMGGLKKRILAILQPVILEYQRKHEARVVAMVQMVMKPLVVILACQKALGDVL